MSHMTRGPTYAEARKAMVANQDEDSFERGNFSEVQSVGARRASIAERMVRYAWRLYSGGTITTEWMRRRFGISKMTATRDMAALCSAVSVDETRIRHNRRSVKLSRRIVRQLGDS